MKGVKKKFIVNDDKLLIFIDKRGIFLTLIHTSVAVKYFSYFSVSYENKTKVTGGCRLFPFDIAPNTWLLLSIDLYTRNN